jgi:hypothetical protein
LPGADHPHIGTRYSLGFFPEKLTKSADRVSLNKVVSFCTLEAILFRSFVSFFRYGVFPFKNEKRLANWGQVEPKESIL